MHQVQYIVLYYHMSTTYITIRSTRIATIGRCKFVAVSGRWNKVPTGPVTVLINATNTEFEQAWHHTGRFAQSCSNVP